MKKFENSGNHQPREIHLKFLYRRGIYAYFADKFHDIEMEIALNLLNSKVLYDKQTLMKAFEKDGVINRLNTNEHIFWLFMTGFEMGERYDGSKAFQEYEYENEDLEFLNTNKPRATNLEFHCRSGACWYFYDRFHDIETNEISMNFTSRQILYDNEFLAKALEKKDVAGWMNTNEHILKLFMTGVRLGQRYDSRNEYQYDK